MLEFVIVVDDHFAPQHYGHVHPDFHHSKDVQTTVQASDSCTWKLK